MSPVFPPYVSGHRIPAGADEGHEDRAQVVVGSALPASRSLSVLRVEGGPTIVSVSPSRARDLALVDGACVDGAELAARIGRAGVILNDPDHLFYLTLDEQAVLRRETRGEHTRPPTGDEAAAFRELNHEAPAKDLDEAYVELDHWLVFGTFVGDTLVAVASMYPWSGSRLADLGVITLPEFRGRGLARATVRAISAPALARGHEPTDLLRRRPAESLGSAS